VLHHPGGEEFYLSPYYGHFELKLAEEKLRDVHQKKKRSIIIVESI
jgi:hypothetical protein